MNNVVYLSTFFILVNKMHKKSKIYKKGSINKIETWSQLVIIEISTMKFTSKDIQTGGNMDGERVYYVSALHGDDRNDGLTEKTPFRTLKMVSRQKRRPGDKILLERGSVFEKRIPPYFWRRNKGSSCCN